MFKTHNQLRLFLMLLFLDGSDSGGSDSDSGADSSSDDSMCSSECADKTANGAAIVAETTNAQNSFDFGGNQSKKAKRARQKSGSKDYRQIPQRSANQPAAPPK